MYQSLIQTLELLKQSSDLSEFELKNTNYPPSITDEYFVGILNRIHSISDDCITILENEKKKDLSTIYILLRCLIDDYIILRWVCLNEEEKDKRIVELESDAHREMRNMVEKLAKINRDLFEDKSNTLFKSKDLEIFDSEYDSGQFDFLLKNKQPLEFHKKETVSKILQNQSLSKAEKVEISDAFMLWKHFSKFAHYSNNTAGMIKEFKGEDRGNLIALQFFIFQI